MKTCNTCKANKICDHNRFGFENCENYIPDNTDLVEVRHGEWIWTENGEEDYEQFWVCSVCKEKSYIETKFCSDCGAKMDGGKNENV